MFCHLCLCKLCCEFVVKIANSLQFACIHSKFHEYVTVSKMYLRPLNSIKFDISLCSI
ncbi:hypothetical protein C2G38_2064326 [Gigaspora rosea]|uniref:Uncharacterized protein n=1 Tax=Gigaspora rosea TaxID=44941 RepID=A0A397W317_9GLOM|nr:hypothetical protein C2G38_2064326 [Gigaspora rosea]